MKFNYKVVYESGYIDYMIATSMGPVIKAVGEYGTAVSAITEIKRLKRLPAGVKAIEIGRREK